MTPILQVAAGGALGAVLRYISFQGCVRLFGAGFPVGTLFVNIVGSFLMGIAFAWMMERGGDARFAPLLMTGLLGGFTTFSAFSLDAVGLFEQGRVMAASGYILGSVVLAILALVLGIALMRWNLA